MTKPASNTPDDTLRFPSLESLRVAHNDLLKQFRASGDISEMRTAVEHFIQRGKATGALLDREADRWAAQSQLDYWATRLYQPGHEPPDATLEKFDPQLAPEIDDSLCPYMGLDAFHESNQSVFFGRGQLINDLIDKLKTSRFLMVVGPSGSGKSSLVRAGVIPSLRKSAISGSDKWIYLPPMVPGTDPLTNLARLILPSDADSESIETTIKHLRQDPDALARLAAERSNESLVLMVDQFEEVFTLCTDEIAQNRFVDNLIGLYQRQGAQHHVIITMRSDFESRVTRFPRLQAIFEQNEIRITSLSASELREAIEAPAALIGLRFEDGVVEALLNDILGEPAALPLLQFTLLELWENRERNRVTWESYKKLGGGRLALARSADGFYNRLIPEEQVTMRRILLKMVRPGEGFEITSNRIPRAVLYQKAEAHDRIDRVLNKLIQARLVRVSEGDIARDDQIEIAHEALIRNWPHLVEWLEEDRVALRQRQRLTTAAEEWQRLGREPSALWRGVLLNESRRYDDLNQLETEFVEAGFVAEQTEVNRKLEETQRQKDLEYAQRLAATEKLRADEQALAATRLRQRAIYLFLISTVAILLSIFTWSARNQAKAAQQESQAAQRAAQTSEARAIANAYVAATQQAVAQENEREAHRQAEIARAGELSAEALIQNDKDFQLSLLLSAEAYKKGDSYLTRWALLDNVNTNPQTLKYLAGHKNIVYSIAFSPDGKILASSSGDQTVILWDTETGQPIGQPLTGHTKSIYTVAFSPDGKTVASGSVDDTIILWDVATHQPIGQPLKGHTSTVFSVAFSPDGKTLASGSYDKSILFWDVATHQPLGAPLKGHTSTVYSVEFSPDGSLLASGSGDKSIILWDVATGQQLEKLSGHTGSVRALTFSPDGNTLASGSTDKSVILWDVTTGQQLEKLSGHTNYVRSLAFSPDGKMLASGSSDKTIILWDMTTGEQLGQPLTGHSGIVRSLAFNPVDSTVLVSGSYDSTIIFWDATRSQSLGQSLTGHRGDVNSVTLSSDGSILASGSDDNTVILWDAKTGKSLLPPLAEHKGDVNSVAFSPDNAILASGSDDDTVILWDAKTGQPLLPPLTGHDGNVNSVAFNRDGTILASGGLDSTIILWDVKTGQPIRPPLAGHTDSVISVAFSPDGTSLASASLDSTIILWDVKTGQPIEKLDGQTELVGNVVFSPDGTILASGSEDNAIILWDVETGQPLGQPLTGHTNYVNSIVFSRDGTTLASGSADNTIILWDVKTDRPLGPPLTGHTGEVNSVAFSPDGKTLVSGSNDNTVILWDIDPQSWLEKVCNRVGRNFTYKEWSKYFRDENYQRTCPNLPYHPTVIAEAVLRTLSKTDNPDRVQAAITTAAAWLNGTSNENSDFVKNVIEEQISETANWKTGDLMYNIAMLASAKELGIDLTNTSKLNEICWYGSLQGYAKDVLPYCEQAVNLDPNAEEYRDSRGLARALTGNMEGAISDFQYYIDYSSRSDRVKKRQQWILDLKAGKNPFTPTVLEQLKNE